MNHEVVPYNLNTRVKISSKCSEGDSEFGDIEILSPVHSRKENGEIDRLIEDPLLMKALQCPECTVIAIPPIFTCEVGHLICSKCRPKTKRCRICASPFTDIRNPTAEGIVGILNVRCRFPGCNLLFRATDVRSHMDSCQFRPFICNEDKNQICKGKIVQFNKFIHHLQAAHDISLEVQTRGVEGSPSFSNCSFRVHEFNRDQKWPFLIIYFEEKHFLVRLRIQKNNGSSNWSAFCIIKLMGSSSEASKYSARVLTQSPHYQIPRMELLLPVYSVHKEDDEIEKTSKVGWIPSQTLLSISKQIETIDSEIEYSFKLLIGIESSSSK